MLSDTKTRNCRENNSDRETKKRQFITRACQKKKKKDHPEIHRRTKDDHRTLSSVRSNSRIARRKGT